ncbi:MAG: GNAT family N-acetyltransferase [Planctomycetota bacterium]
MNFTPTKSGIRNVLLTGEVLRGEILGQLDGSWDDLYSRAKDAPPYLSRPWLGSFVSEGRLVGAPVAVTAWKDDRLVGLLLLAIRSRSGIRFAEPIGAGHPSYLGLLIDPECPEAVAKIAELCDRHRVADIIVFEDLSSADLATNALIEVLQSGSFVAHREHRNICHRINLSCSYEDYLARTKSGKHRGNLRREEKRLRNAGEVRLECLRGSEVTSATVSRLAAIQNASWIERRGAAVLKHAFYEKLLLAMAEQGFVRVWILTIDNTDAAFVCCLVRDDRVQYEWTAFRLGYERFSIGKVLTANCIRDACRDGIAVFDFCQGDAEYKRFWGTEHHDVYRTVLGRGVRGRVGANVYHAIWLAARSRRVRGILRRLRRTFRSSPATKSQATIHTVDGLSTSHARSKR